jgi:hypothetical protein
MLPLRQLSHSRIAVHARPSPPGNVTGGDGFGGHAATVAAPGAWVVRTGAWVCDFLRAWGAFYCGLGCCRLRLADCGAL